MRVLPFPIALLSGAYLFVGPSVRLVHAQAARVALVIGSNGGDVQDPTLRYAESDAERMSALLIGLGGSTAESTVLLKGPGIEDVRKAFGAVASQLKKVQGDHLFFFYYSGHADGQSLHLGRDKLSFAELKSTILELPASMRVVIVDACQSGELTRLKGGQAGPTFDIDSGVESPRGIAILASGRATELAQESDELGGSFFTHHLYAGLLGMADRDHDGRVSLAESFDYASGHTLEATVGTWAGPQHPTFRYDHSGQQDVMLTHPGGSGAGYGRLALDRPGWYFVRRRHGPILAEIVSRGREEIALEDGTYELSLRERDHLEVAELTMESTGRVRVSELATRQEAFGRIVRKGGGFRPRAYALSASGLVRSSLASLGPAVGMSLAARIDWAAASLELHGGVAQALDSTAVPSQTTDMALTLAALRAWDFGIGTVAGGIEAGWAGFRQRVASAPAHWVHAPMVGPIAWLELPLATRLYVRGEVALPIYNIPLQTGDGQHATWLTSLRGGLGAGGYF